MFKKIKKVFLIFSVFGFSIFVVILGVSVKIANDMYQDQLVEWSATTAKYLPKFAEDLKVIKAAHIYDRVTFKKNAEPYVSKFVLWETTVDAKSPAAKELLRKHSDWSKTEDGFKNLLDDHDFKSMDVSWVAGLKNFDHLDLNTNEQITKELNRVPSLGGIERVGVHSTLPLLNFMDLLDQVTVFSLKKSQGTQADRREAIEMIHHVAHLLVSTSSLVGQLVTVVALRREIFFSNKLEIKITAGLNDDIVNRMRRVGFSWPGVMQLAETKAISTDLSQYMKPEFMLCGAASEMPFPIMFSEYLEPRWPFEPSFQGDIDRHRTVYQSLFSTCHTDSYAVYLKAPTKKVWSKASGLLNVPYIRRAMASTTMSIGMPNFLRSYQKEE